MISHAFPRPVILFIQLADDARCKPKSISVEVDEKSVVGGVEGRFAGAGCFRIVADYTINVIFFEGRDSNSHHKSRARHLTPEQMSESSGDFSSTLKYAIEQSISQHEHNHRFKHPQELKPQEANGN